MALCTMDTTIQGSARLAIHSRSLFVKGWTMLRYLGVLVLGLGASLLAIPDPVSPDPESPRPIAAADTVFIEDMTWMEVRDAMKAGKDTVIVATGGIEQNGPYLVTGKHNVVLRGTTAAIARKLGNALPTQLNQQGSDD